MQFIKRVNNNLKTNNMKTRIKEFFRKLDESLKEWGAGAAYAIHR